jgi:hypothetical protein
MAKLVDALVSGTSVSNDVQVRVLFWAQVKTKDKSKKTKVKRQKQVRKILLPSSFYLLSFIFYLDSAQMVKLVDTPA